MNKNKNAGYQSVIWDGTEEFGKQVSMAIAAKEMRIKTDFFFSLNPPITNPLAFETANF